MYTRLNVDLMCVGLDIDQGEFIAHTCFCSIFIVKHTMGKQNFLNIV